MSRVLRGGLGSIEVGLPDAFRGVLTVGDSVAVNGVCLTARAVTGATFAADVSTETSTRTTLGALRAGSSVNLELAATAGRALGGHWVLGHIDAVGKIGGLFRSRDGWSLVVSYPPAFARYVADKGSIAVDGVSLTPFDVRVDTFRCAAIPETYETTILHERRAGDPVNLEFDVLAKYVERMLRDVHTHR